MQTIKQTDKCWTVWVGGGEVNDYYLTEAEANDIAQAWRDKGYDEVAVERVNRWVPAESAVAPYQTRSYHTEQSVMTT